MKKSDAEIKGLSDFFGWHDIPNNYGVCAICDGQLSVDVYECEVETGTPTETGFTVFCKTSKTAIDEAFIYAMNNNRRFRQNAVEQCNWSYDELLIASREAFNYLKTLKK